MSSPAPSSSPPSPTIFRPWQPTSASQDRPRTPRPTQRQDRGEGGATKRPRDPSSSSSRSPPPPPYKLARALSTDIQHNKMAAPSPASFLPAGFHFHSAVSCLPPTTVATDTLGGLGGFGGLGELVPLLGGLVPAAEVERVCAKRPRPKRFSCNQCGSAFSNKGQLKGHVRIHTGERPFACGHRGCNKRFTRNEELTRHTRIHSGARPFPCPLCDKRFGRKDHLKKHVRTHQRPLQVAPPGPPTMAPRSAPHLPLPPVPPLSFTMPMSIPSPLTATLASLAATQPLLHHLHHLHHHLQLPHTPPRS
ncbi:hypothetical protein Pmani_024466 [Petrolisthes manimaculis]|uniref:C2H2-type domain-containing protein n=1 Tax=Petrolisthes manimaculis TaxID=1843537 RepID=A0AAE1U269_9EUCA|nr:hypothetical protein Pmani_024466 [Petrolisthes manimaculis]